MVCMLLWKRRHRNAILGMSFTVRQQWKLAEGGLPLLVIIIKISAFVSSLVVVLLCCVVYVKLL